MLGKKKVTLEPQPETDFIKEVPKTTTINSSKTTTITARPSYVGQSSMIKLIKTNTSGNEVQQKGKTPIIFGQLKKKAANSLLR
jgi:hypothetical protein